MNKDLLHSLEELGLSKNEAKAYLALISNGPQSSSDLAFKTGIARAKIYSVIKRLVKKDLAIITSNKPLIVDALTPEDIFTKFISHHERLVDSAKNAMKVLEEIRLKNSSNLARVYHVSRLEINNIITNAKDSMLLMLDRYGINIFNESREYVINALKNGIDIKMLAEIEPDIPSIEFKIYNTNNNIIIVDGERLFIIDSNYNRCYIFDDKEFVDTYTQAFYDAWNKCLMLV